MHYPGQCQEKPPWKVTNPFFVSKYNERRIESTDVDGETKLAKQAVLAALQIFASPSLGLCAEMTHHNLQGHQIRHHSWLHGNNAYIKSLDTLEEMFGV